MKNARPKQVAQAKKSKADLSKTTFWTINWFENRYFVYGCLAIVLLFVMLVRTRLLHLPLERDEGEYALMGQLLLKGIPAYEMAYNMKLPGTYYMYALAMAIFGESLVGIHLGLLLVNLTSTLLLFFIGKKLVNTSTGLFAAVSFALLTLSPGVLGFAAHATHFIVLFGLLGLLSLLQYAEQPIWKRLTLSGFCFGLAFLMKQQAVFLLPFGLLALWLIEQQRTPDGNKRTGFNLGLFTGAMVLPYMLVVMVALVTGSFDNFWHWTVEYAGQYVGIKTGADAWRFLKLYFPLVFSGYELFWLIGTAGLVVLFFSQNPRKYRWLILAFAVCSVACVIPGYYFRLHYFIVFMPALALLVGVTLNFLLEKWSPRQVFWGNFLPFLLFSCMIFLAIFKHGSTFFKDDMTRIVTRTYSSANPFAASLEIARFIRAYSSEEDKIAILGSEPQIYFYSDRLPATGYIYTYPLMENQAYSLEMQRDIIAEIEKAKPKFLIFVNSSLSWTRAENASNHIFDWYGAYKNNYHMVGLIDLNPSGKPTYVWREAISGYKALNKEQVWVFERK
ncbi:MAG: ArnT family glycosyltransferase [Saprospiraceae bacterium]